MQKKFEDGEIKDALLRAYKFYGENKLTHLMYKEFVRREKNPNNPHPLTIIRRYSTWNKAIEAIGLNPIKSRSKYTNRIDQQASIEALVKVKNSLGHWPSRREYDDAWRIGNKEYEPLRSLGYPSEATIRSRKGWKAAIEQARAIVED